MNVKFESILVLYQPGPNFRGTSMVICFNGIFQICFNPVDRLWYITQCMGDFTSESWSV